MADINIERKRTSIWPWLLGIILIAAVAIAAWQFLGNRELADEPAAAEMGAEPLAPASPSTTTSGL